MMKHKIALAGSVLGLLAMPGCALLGGGKPAQLYRFGGSTPPASRLAAPAGARVILLSPVRFAADINSDRIVAVRGAEAMPIAGVRWSAPASALFEGALRDRLTSQVPPLSLADRRDGVVVDSILQVTVDRFEARYTGEAALTAPIVAIAGHAEMVDAKTRLRIGSLQFAAERPATSNLVPGIVAAFDGVTADSTAQLADWIVNLPAGAAQPQSPASH